MKKNLLIVGLLALVAILAISHKKDNKPQPVSIQTDAKPVAAAVVPVEQPSVDTNHIKIHVAQISLQ